MVPVNKVFQRAVFILSLAIFAALGSGFVLGEFSWFGVHAGGEQDGAYRQVSVYQQVLKKVQTDYVVEPNMAEVTTGALHGLLESLDADSSYLTATEYKIYKDRPTTGVAQVGITVSKRFGYATIVSVLPGSPADKEHLTDGDVIESIGEQSTREMSLAVIKLMLDGKPGSTLALSVVPAPFIRSEWGSAPRLASVWMLSENLDQPLCRLVTRYERRSDVHHAFTALACSLICFNKLQRRS